MIRLKDLAAGVDPLVIVDGQGPPGSETRLMTASAEGVSVGPSPVDPKLVARARVVRATRRVRSVSRHLATSGLATGRRLSFPIEWSGLSKAERDSLATFLQETCGGGELPFDIAPDGASSAPGDRMTVRQVAPLADSHVSHGGGNRVYSLSVEVEEVF